MSDDKQPSFKEKVTKIVQENFHSIMVSLFVLQLGNFISQYVFMRSSFPLNVVLVSLFVAFFLLFKDISAEKHKSFAFKMLKMSIAIFLMTSVNHMFISITSGFTNPEQASALFRLSYFVNFFIVIVLVLLLRHEGVQGALETIYEKNVIETLQGPNAKKKKNAGDVQIAVDVETKEPVIIPFKDRFLHALILGPTGSGKTSQVIIPMINQDMQNEEAGITVLEPKGDLAEKVYAMAKHYGRKAVYFNPLLPDCPYFNPLYGLEEDVIENITTTFRMLNPDSPQFFLDHNENLLRNALKVLKRLYGNKATMIDLSRLISNTNGQGRKMVTQFSRLSTSTEEEAKENADVAAYFLNDYFNDKSKTYEHCSDTRTRVSKIISNKYMRRVLNPPNGENDVNFDEYLANGDIIAISTAQGKLRDLGRFLGYFIILQLQSSVFRRPGNENTRRAHFLYIDEFQVYSNPGFADMLTQGRSYRVASHLATQNRALIGMGSGQEGKDFIELVSTNARNVIIFPGGNAQDAKYYSDQFGEVLKHEIQKGITKEKFNPLYGIRRLGYDKVNIRKTEKMEARFSPTDIIYRPFGEITYVIIKNNSIQTPGVGKIQFIPRELNDKLDQMVEEYNQEQERKEFAQNPISEEADSVIDFEADDVVVSPVVKKEEPKRDPNKQYYRGKEIVNPNEDFMDDFVLTEEEVKKELSTEVDLSDEDDLI